MLAKDLSEDKSFGELWKKRHVQGSLQEIAANHSLKMKENASKAKSQHLRVEEQLAVDAAAHGCAREYALFLNPFRPIAIHSKVWTPPSKSVKRGLKAKADDSKSWRPDPVVASKTLLGLLRRKDMGVVGHLSECGTIPRAAPVGTGGNRDPI